MRAWFDATWPAASPNRGAARESVLAALRHWADRGWLPPETHAALAAALQ